MIVPISRTLSMIEREQAPLSQSIEIEELHVAFLVPQNWYQPDSGGPDHRRWFEYGRPVLDLYARRGAAARATPEYMLDRFEADLMEAQELGTLVGYEVIYRRDLVGEGVGRVIAGFRRQFPGGAADLTFVRFFPSPTGAIDIVYRLHDRPWAESRAVELLRGITPLP